MSYITLCSVSIFHFLLGNIKKCKQILEKALECSALPPEILEIALKNLSLQKAQLLSEEEKENLAGKSLRELSIIITVLAS